MYPASQLDGNEDEDGNLIEDVVVRELRKMKANKKHLSQGFWKSLIVRHKLSGMTSDALVQPTVAEGVSRELDAALKLCHEANPARRSCTRLQRYLKYTDTMNSTEVFGVLKASYPSPSLSSSMSRAMLEIVLEWCGRVRADEKYPEYFKVVRCSLDQIMTQMWQRASSDGLSRSHFLRTQRATLRMFLDMSLATKLDRDTSNGDKLEHAEIEAMLRSSAIGGELFAAEVLDLESLTFVAEIERRLGDLEDNGYNLTEQSNMKRILMATTAGMEMDVWESFQDKQIKVAFLGSEICAAVDNHNDEWQRRYDCRLKTAAVSRNKVVRKPWDRRWTHPWDSLDD